MMNVGILTFHRAKNYGAFIQAYALHQKLSKTYPKINFEIINYHPLSRALNSFVDIILVTGRRGLFNGYCKYIINRNFSKALKELPLSNWQKTTNSSEKLFKYIDNKYDAVIVGSDAVFNWVDLQFPNAFFLGGVIKSSILSYAASAHGNKFYDMTEKQRKYLENIFKKFKYIGVRDKNTESFVKYCNTSVDVEQNCDPTALLEFDYETKNVEKKIIKYADKPIIILMLKKREIGKLIKELYGKEYNIISIVNNNKYSDCYIYDLTPFEWSKIFKYAKLTVTDYFHGTLLSLKNNIPVISIDMSNYKDKYESKIKDLLYRKLKLMDFYFDIDLIRSAEGLKKLKSVGDRALLGFYEKEIILNLLEYEKEFDSFKNKFDKILVGNNGNNNE